VRASCGCCQLLLTSCRAPHPGHPPERSGNPGHFPRLAPCGSLPAPRACNAGDMSCGMSCGNAAILPALVARTCRRVMTVGPRVELAGVAAAGARARVGGAGWMHACAARHGPDVARRRPGQLPLPVPPNPSDLLPCWLLQLAPSRARFCGYSLRGSAGQEALCSARSNRLLVAACSACCSRCLAASSRGWLLAPCKQPACAASSLAV